MARPGPLRGASRVLAAVALLRRERGLWLVCALPLALNLLLFAAAIAVFATSYGDLVAWLEALLAIGDPEQWYEWLWVAPLRALAWLVRWLVIAVAAIAVYLLFTVLGGIVASPFLDVLSERVERIVGGREPASARGWRQVLRASWSVALEDAKRVLFFLAGQALCLLLGLVPGLQPLAAAGVLLFTILFLSLEYTAYVLDRHQVPFRARRRWLWQQRGGMLGFGAAALASFLVPGLNFLALPVLVTAGTLLALEAGLPGQDAA